VDDVPDEVGPSHDNNAPKITAAKPRKTGISDRRRSVMSGLL